MPRLWSDLELCLVYEETDAVAEHLLELYLIKSGSAALILDISAQPMNEDDDEGEPEEDSCVWPILQALLACGHRWAKCSFSFGWNLLSRADEFLSQSTYYQYSNLKDFILRSMAERSSQSRIFSSIWQHAPALLSLEAPTFDEGNFSSTSLDLQKLATNNWNRYLSSSLSKS
ncbi:hypothetical protein D9758_013301 [Tetrapyrgos nigripes]|uniref:Uncharacterized protein n=1 Tax=Tetrapyrgos nigripes TaxID=182062 RepID=A0A8H5CEX6_9AGAR|nr:hypothetical protein D9758_013301 [Tetrapyrgos nigripes]